MASREATPPPIIGKAGNLTVFITPSPKRHPNPSPNPPSPPSPSPSPSPRLNLTPSPRESPVGKLEKTNSPSPVKEKAFVLAPPPVQVPPKQYEKGKDVNSHGSAFGFFWDAVARVQEAHSSLDEYLANWFGLDQSKYQWALNDYYETNSKEMETIKGSKPKEVISKGQVV
ncbi:Hydroxyproline-rich glycoprotein-like [Rhynchospora pubera]|uniref:Hydroxyproline-rich glycoprotein-like n=1 Tax=Rhynchospora pubera TaxID=906938 RepID=A0AAV8DF27_9POAL|nr:Hydroxyproline-rich glycoprotein-like [Rhynchospora pubera]KAJ4765135.1 Hydroxyproline-rich glycoprotein-like [Rhynchospora pubera]KAJ4817854.1 Hydroxyproline-rich glycoprotein-like [Rhynchospora pubera]